MDSWLVSPLLKKETRRAVGSISQSNRIMPRVEVYHGFNHPSLPKRSDSSSTLATEIALEDSPYHGGSVALHTTGHLYDQARILFPDKVIPREKALQRMALATTASAAGASDSESGGVPTHINVPLRPYYIHHPNMIARHSSAPTTTTNGRNISTTASLPLPATTKVARPAPITQRAKTESHRPSNSAQPQQQQQQHRPLPRPRAVERRVVSTTSTLSAETRVGSSSLPPSSPYHRRHHSTGSSVVTSSAVLHASLLGDRPKRAAVVQEETVVLTMAGYCAKESLQTLEPLTPAQVVVSSRTGQNSPSITAREYRRQVRTERRSRRKLYATEFVPHRRRGWASQWHDEALYWRRRAVEAPWHYGPAQRRRGHRTILLYPTPDLPRNDCGCLC
jgi:hypothetical protein